MPTPDPTSRRHEPVARRPPFSSDRGVPRTRRRAVFLSALSLALLAAPLSAQEAPPAFAEVSGHAFGERITLHHEMARYLERLAETSDRVALLDQGASWEGRRLLAAVVTSPDNHARLDPILTTARRLGDARGTPPEAVEGMIDGQPVIVWMGGSIHGNELSGSEGLLKVLERLATADDPATRDVLENTVVVIDPMLNPDGRDGFAVKNHQSLGAGPEADPDDWNNDYTGWQGVKYRTGHYYFDTNRDWFAHTQKETRARIATIVAWRPQVSVDAHEMGRAAEFYFDPAAEPWGPYFPEAAREWMGRFNEAYAAAFDSAGFEYMTRERYNYFYPGYTTSMSSYQGSIGMLYEQGTSAGPAIERPDGSVRTLAEALEHHYVAAWAALRMAAERREDLLRDYHDRHRTALADGGEGARRYLIPAGPDAPGDPNLRAELVQLLLRNGVEVGRLAGSATVDGLRDRAGRSVGPRPFAAGTYVVEAAQPRNRLIRVLLEPEAPLPEPFLAEARARVERDESPRFYDITAWSLPLLFDLPVYGSTAGARPDLDLVAPEISRDPTEVRREGSARSASAWNAGPEIGPPPREISLPERDAGYAYLIDGRQAAAVAALWHLRDRGYRAGMLTRATRIGERDVGSGTVVVRVGGNPDRVHEAVRELAPRFRLDVRAVDTGLAAPGGPSLGSADVVAARPARIALLAEGAVHGYSFGWAWYTLEEQYGIPTTVLRTSTFSPADLGDHEVLVIPDLFSAGGLAAELGEAGAEGIADWVRAGGTLVTIGEGTDFARESLELLDLRSWYETEDGEDAQRLDVPGAVVAARVDTLAWLAAGRADPGFPALVTSDRVLLPPEGPPDSGNRVVVRYAGPDETLRLSGHLWPENDARLRDAVFLYEQRVGAGRVIAFAEEPNFRGYWRGANRFFLNAVVIGPSAG